MPYISKEFIDKLLSEVDILDVFQYIGAENIQKRGANYFCLSPFKDEKTPSCLIKKNSQRFIDFSSDISGNAITLIMEKYKYSYPEAVEKLAGMIGIKVEYENKEITKEYEEKRAKEARFKKYLKALANKFQKELHKLPVNHPAREELKKRNYTKEDISEWGIGYAPGSKFMYNLFRDAGDIEAGKQLGLINDNDNDKIWNRLVYPIFDARNEIIGFASRDLSGEKNSAKWMNPAENDLYRKSNTFYGIHAAKSAIIKANKVWIVEGYNDVIAWHKNGLENTISISGTAITDNQIKEIGKLTKKVTICLDGDRAGKEKMFKYIPKFISQGFSVEICELPDELDPDDFSRKFERQINSFGLGLLLKDYLISGFKVLLLAKLEGDELDRANGIREIAEMISKIPDITLRNIYTDELIKHSKQKASFIKSLMREQEAEVIRLSNDEYDNYELPRGVKTPLEQLIPIIEKYQLFVSDNQVFIQDRFDVPYTFKSVSNFSVEILQHMNDEKYASKLLRICNVNEEERIFDVPADALTTPLDFKKQCAKQGNYRWLGNLKELDKLTAYLYDKMGVGRKIDVLGWNAEGFYCWNNSVTIPGEAPILIDKNGIFHHEGHTYYVPSANDIYKQNPYKFAQQKKIQLKSQVIPMEAYLEQMKKVHREFAIIGMLFAFASAHQDIIVDIAKGFPLMFLYGPPSTGKDELYGCIKKMFGIAKTDFINLENKQSTGKAKLRSFAEFSNMVVHLSEYTNGDKEIDGMLKGIWDRGSYKRATLDSQVSTDSTPILCSAIVTGNQSPTDEAVLTRLLYGEMTKNQFTLEEKREFEKLEQQTTDHITAYMDKVIWYRPLFEKKFGDKFNMYKKMLSQRPAFKDTIDRIITNYSILGATHEILKETNDVIFPFTTQQMLEVFDDFVLNLKKKLDSANIFSRFWDVFVACLYGSETNKLKLNVHIDVQGNEMMIRFTEVYNRIQTEWFPRFSESCPSKQTLIEKLKESNCFIAEKKSHRFGGQINTSAYVLNLDKIENKENILFAINMQQDEINEREIGVGNIFNYPPATPNTQGLNEEHSDDLPY